MNHQVAIVRVSLDPITVEDLKILGEGTWRIIPLSKQLVTPVYRPWNGHLEGEQAYLGDLLTMIINHLLTGMILQVQLYPCGTHGCKSLLRKPETNKRQWCSIKLKPLLLS